MRDKISTGHGQSESVDISGSDETLLDVVVKVCVEVDALHWGLNLRGGQSYVNATKPPPSARISAPSILQPGRPPCSVPRQLEQNPPPATSEVFSRQASGTCG